MAISCCPSSNGGGHCQVDAVVLFLFQHILERKKRRKERTVWVCIFGAWSALVLQCPENEPHINRHARRVQSLEHRETQRPRHVDPYCAQSNHWKLWRVVLGTSTFSEFCLTMLKKHSWNCLSTRRVSGQFSFIALVQTHCLCKGCLWANCAQTNCELESTCAPRNFSCI